MGGRMIKLDRTWWRILVGAVVAVLVVIANEDLILAQEGKEQGTIEERQTYCSKMGDFSDPVPYSSHLTVHYLVARDVCYRKEPDLAPKTNTIAVQKLDGAKIAPILRIITQYNYTDDGWKQFKSALKEHYGNDYSEVSADTVPLFSPNLKKQAQASDVVKITHWMDSDEVGYYFTDLERMYSYINYSFVREIDENVVYIDYK